MGRPGQRRHSVTVQFDDADADLRGILWRLSGGQPTIYITSELATRLQYSQGETVAARRIVMERIRQAPLDSGQRVKIKDGNPLNCQRDNLQLA